MSIRWRSGTTEGYGTADPPNFHDLFPHFYLTSHKRSILLSLVHIFVSIAQSFGIAAFPFRLPYHVLVHITVPDTEVDNFYVDVFEVLICGTTFLRSWNVKEPMQCSYHAPQGQSLHPIVVKSPTYLPLARAIFNTFSIPLFLVLTGTGQSVPRLMSQADPLDCATFITEVPIPSLSNVREVQNDLRQASQPSLEEEAITAQEIKLRTPNTTVHYFVGILFEHGSLHYTALITVGCEQMSDMTFLSRLT
ncbi:hypothetical protein EV368DRAFT_66886 [Lentinula lateritia]|nr:hypothetical protein EV368DRAFT_66886 [Lentinula lateritia]